MIENVQKNDGIFDAAYFGEMLEGLAGEEVAEVDASQVHIYSFLETIFLL